MTAVSPPGNFAISGIQAGQSGQVLDLENDTGYVCSLVAGSALSSAGNRINAARVIPSPGCTRLIYSTNAQMWLALS